MDYIQVIKTTDAELKGYRHLLPVEKSGVIPLFELTRSRTTSIVPEGDIARRIENIKDSVDGNPFILDLTSHEDLSNSQIDDLLDDTNGFSAWTSFLEELDFPNLIPVIHVYEDGDDEDVVLQVDKLSDQFEQLAFRAQAEDENLTRYLQAIERGMRAGCELIVIIDGEFLAQNNYRIKKELLLTRVEEVEGVLPDARVSVCCSSFPSSVRDVPGCDDDFGVVPILEWDLYLELRRDKPNLIYGDYGSIHPVRYRSRGGGWIPRVDYPLTAVIPYFRYRREDGGYIDCAVEMTDFESYDGLECWGTEQIELASEGAPNGKSPSFWIAVRMNIHTTRKVHDLQKLLA